MRILKQTFLLLRKDLLLETRRRESLLTMFFFGTLLLFVFHFSFDLTPERVAEMAPALLWLAFLFTEPWVWPNSSKPNEAITVSTPFCCPPWTAARFFSPKSVSILF